MIVMIETLFLLVNEYDKIVCIYLLSIKNIATYRVLSIYRSFIEKRQMSMCHLTDKYSYYYYYYYFFFLSFPISLIEQGQLML